MRILDRYVIREVIPPFLLALAIFTFILAVDPMLEHAEGFLAKGVPMTTVGFLLLTLLPQALGVTIPMAFLAGLLVALGRMSADREAVALLACGISPARLLRPVLLLAALVAGVDLYIMTRLIADANQTFREVSYRLLEQQTESDIKPRVFYEGFQGKVLYVRDTLPGGAWSGVLLADTSRPGRPTVVTADTARLVLNPERRQVEIWFPSAQEYLPGSDPRVYETASVGDLHIPIPADSVFGTGNLQLSRGLAEKHIADLRKDIEDKRKIGMSPHNELMYIHQMFAFPVACVTFGLLGLALGVHTRREGKLAGLTLGLAVVFVYYGLHAQAEAWTKAQAFPAAWARWVPNVVLGPLAVLLVWARTRGVGVSLQVPGWITRLWRRRPDSSGTPGRSDRVVVVIRFPEMGVPRPRLLDAYVGARYLRMVALAFVALLGLYYIGTFIDLAEKLFKGQATGAMLAAYLWYSTPQFISYVLPIATLIAVLGTVGALTRTSELTVMRACGISLYRIALPLITLALVWTVLLFVLEERVVAHANRKAEALEDAIRGRPPHTVDVMNRNWVDGGDGSIYYYTFFESRRNTLTGLSVFETATNPYRLTGHSSAREATFRGGDWEAVDGWLQRFGSPGDAHRENFSRRPISLPPVEYFRDIQKSEAELMTVGQLMRYIARMSSSGVNLAEQRVNLHHKIAFPLITLVMTLLAVPFGVTTGRKGALYGIGLAVALAFTYFFLTTFFLAAGASAILPAPLAAWAANLLFLAGAVYLMLTVRT